ncbi:LamG domain-containing protein, partial [Candidatus Woesearchaeota archaeon]|nr:LamG domain-containing protein [Candidatus Woesearchaeota archaeon]
TIIASWVAAGFKPVSGVSFDTFNIGGESVWLFDSRGRHVALNETRARAGGAPWSGVKNNNLNNPLTNLDNEAFSIPVAFVSDVSGTETSYLFNKKFVESFYVYRVLTYDSLGVHNKYTADFPGLRREELPVFGYHDEVNRAIVLGYADGSIFVSEDGVDFVEVDREGVIEVGCESDVDCLTGQVCDVGVCVDEVVDAECTDSDGGLDYFVKGTAIGESFSGGEATINDGCIISDELNNGFLREGICEGFVATWVDYDCPNGCDAGACIPEGPVEPEDPEAAVSLKLDLSFDDAATPLNDSTDFENHGTCATDTTDNCPELVDRGFDIGNAYRFDGGSEDKIDVELSGSLEITDWMSISVWVLPEQAPTGEGSIIASAFSEDDEGENKKGWILGNEDGDSDEIHFTMFNRDGESISINYSGFFNENIDQWTHVVATYNKTSERVKLYINGGETDGRVTKIRLDEEGNFLVEVWNTLVDLILFRSDSDIAYDSDVPLRIGCSSDNCEKGMWKGYIDGVKIYRGVLTGDGVNDLYVEEKELADVYARIIDDFKPITAYYDENFDVISLWNAEGSYINYDGTKWKEIESPPGLFRDFNPNLAYYHDASELMVYFDDVNWVTLKLTSSDDTNNFEPIVGYSLPSDDVRGEAIEWYGDGGYRVFGGISWGGKTSILGEFEGFVPRVGLVSDVSGSNVEYLWGLKGTNRALYVNEIGGDARLIDFEGGEDYSDGLPDELPDELPILGYHDPFIEEIVLWYGNESYGSGNGRDYDKIIDSSGSVVATDSNVKNIYSRIPSGFVPVTAYYDGVFGVVTLWDASGGYISYDRDGLYQVESPSGLFKSFNPNLGYFIEAQNSTVYWEGTSWKAFDFEEGVFDYAPVVGYSIKREGYLAWEYPEIYGLPASVLLWDSNGDYSYRYEKTDGSLAWSDSIAPIGYLNNTAPTLGFHSNLVGKETLYLFGKNESSGNPFLFLNNIDEQVFYNFDTDKLPEGLPNKLPITGYYDRFNEAIILWYADGSAYASYDGLAFEQVFEPVPVPDVPVPPVSPPGGGGGGGGGGGSTNRYTTP